MSQFIIHNCRSYSLSSSLSPSEEDGTSESRLVRRLRQTWFCAIFSSLLCRRRHCHHRYHHHHHHCRCRCHHHDHLWFHSGMLSCMLYYVIMQKAGVGRRGEWISWMRTASNKFPIPPRLRQQDKKPQARRQIQFGKFRQIHFTSQTNTAAGIKTPRLRGWFQCQANTAMISNNSLHFLHICYSFISQKN